MQLHCPICKEKVVWEENPFRPFCSERCKILDLGAWASAKYRVELKDKNEKPLADSDNATPGNGQKGRD